VVRTALVGRVFQLERGQHVAQSICGGGAGYRVALIGAAIAVASSRGGQLIKPQTIHVVARGGQITFLPINHQRHSFTGDLVDANTPAFAASGHRRVGTIHAECTLVEPKGVVGECRVQIFLHGGLVTLDGPIHFGVNGRSRGAVTGGAGRFRKARGQVTFVNSTGQTQGFILELEP
jgi:hypothetical protein